MQRNGTWQCLTATGDWARCDLRGAQPPVSTGGQLLVAQRNTQSNASCLLPAVYGGYLWFDCIPYTDSSGTADICPTTVRAGGAGGRAEGVPRSARRITSSVCCSLESTPASIANTPTPGARRRAAGTCAATLGSLGWTSLTPSPSGKPTAQLRGTARRQRVCPGCVGGMGG